LLSVCAAAGRSSQQTHGAGVRGVAGLCSVGFAGTGSGSADSWQLVFFGVMLTKQHDSVGSGSETGVEGGVACEAALRPRALQQQRTGARATTAASPM
jgi:hypothetical protein